MCPKNIFRTPLLVTDFVSTLILYMYFECKADAITLGWMADVMLM